MSMRGELGIFSAAEILQLIGSQEKSGVLELKSKGRTAVIFFGSGKITSARDRRQSTSDPFLSYLLENGEITIQDVHTVLEAKKTEGGDVVTLMLAHNILSDERLGEMLSQYALQIVTNVVKWETGTYEFTASNDGLPDKALGKPLRLEPILMEALRRKDEVEEIRRFLPGLDATLDLAVTEYESLPLEETDLAVLKLVDGARTIDQIIEESPVDEVETLDVLEKLFALGIISIASKAPESSAASRVSGRKAVLIALAALAVAIALRLGVARQIGFPGTQAADLRVKVSALTEAREMENIRFALAAYSVVRGAYPNDLRELVTAGMATQDAVQDHNGRPYPYYRTQDGSYELGPVPPLR